MCRWQRFMLGLLDANQLTPTQLRKVAATLQISTHELMFDEVDPFENKADEILKELFSGDVQVTLHRIERKNGFSDLEIEFLENLRLSFLDKDNPWKR